MNSLTRIDRQRGLTLVEIMVALVISLFLLAGLLQMFIGTRQSARVQENLSRVQENGRYAIDFIGRIIRLTGSRSRFTIEGGQSYNAAFPAFQAIQGTNDDGSNSSDTITVAYEGEKLVDYITTETCDNNDENDRKKCLITDCLNFKIGNNTIARNTLNIINNSLQCRASRIHVLPTGNVVVVPDETRSILEDVENIQILYGENTDSDVFGVADRYVPANNVGSWDRVVSVRISVLVRTQEDNLVAAPQPYNFNGATVTPTDRRLRRVFTTTITLRNRA